MEQKKIDRINELSRISRERELTPAEAQERQALREEYIAAFRASLTGQLDNTVIVDKDGNRTRLQRHKKLS